MALPIQSCNHHAGKVNPLLWALAPESPSLPATTCACLPSCIESLTPATNATTTTAACDACAPCLRAYATRVSANTKQVHTYLTAYAAAPLSSIPPASMSHLASLIPPPAPAAAPAAHTAAALAHLSAAAHLARTQWTQFDTPMAIAGLAVLALAAVLTAGALHATLFLRALNYARLITSARSFFVLSCPPIPPSPLLPARAALMLALMAIRAAIPFSNSLVLAEAQVTQYLVVTGVLVLATAIVSRAAVVRRSLAHSGHRRVPPRNAPAVSAAVTFFALTSMLSRVLLPVPPPVSHSRRTQNIEPGEDGSPRTRHVATVSLCGFRLSFEVSFVGIRNAVRLGVAAVCGVIVFASSSWLLRNLCVITIAIQARFHP